MRNTPANSLRHSASSLLRVEFLAQAGTKDVELQGGDEIVGQWEKPLRLVSSANAQKILIDFANQPEPFQDFRDNWKKVQQGLLDQKKAWRQKPAIVNFTRRYGPLQITPKAGEEFRFPLHEFAILLGQFQGYWQDFGGPAAVTTQKPSAWASAHKEEFSARAERWEGLVAHGHPFWLRPGDDFITRSQNRLRYGAGNLWQFLQLMLFAAPGERLRKCRCPSCTSPYFIARHLRQRFCSEPCAKWAQHEHKLNWWKEHGSDWRKRQKS